MPEELVSLYMNWQDLARILKPGDLIEFNRFDSSASLWGRGIYQHWAVYIGRQPESGVHLVIHYSNEETNAVVRGLGNFLEILGTAVVKWDALERVAGGSSCRKNNGWDKVDTPFNREEIVERAKNKLGEAGFNLVTNNCEHFANLCRYGKKRSGQVTDTANTALGTMTTLAVGGLFAVGVAYFSETPEQQRERERNERKNSTPSSQFRMQPQ